ncbi:hypothetical protein A2625_00390 [candidate division WOR-1 bacterium RIFCSPHIGHO2_01_FULL_53_15]|uniref:Nucleotidyl transferase AbiEii/AbiGii toxin family protein n=1 Tax=candidate division WOR-1 bacterium RIFCSPHIGHO2_01_FULL_53_15 TaxID=1802564 RepID=A0A1F4PZ94_UNCSA|nr:MAG: hypothetical protein A2625_00390 [candidate division WOR-1 bacterium RIFCSPHIGHO2_01_FULL_53_15]OGC10479.1 MAG: hypothetical protein A3D23_03480 [candidate division WOR-1 bacterium RIFCSPHIGHO2_02_FULL_53_26]
MLSEKQINEIAVKLQSDFINVAREYVQNQFLSIFYSLPESDTIFFKGGTALRILYRSPRFSEDLDFSTSKIDQNRIENLLQETMLRLDREGLAIELIESSLTSGGYYGEISSAIGAHKFNISLEISGRKKRLSGHLITVDNPYIPPYSVMALKREELIAEKIEALLNRQKSRDFYDLYFMLRANLLPDKAVLKKIMPMLAGLKIDFKKELGKFLPQGHQRIIKGFKKVLESELRRYI